MRASFGSLLILVAATSQALKAADPPSEWIEPSTGHRVIRLSQEDGTQSFYFHQNAYTQSGDKLVVSTPSGLASIDLKSRKNEPLVEGRAGNVVVGKRGRKVYYTQSGVAYCTDIDGRQTRKIAELPPEMRRGSGFAVNADETLLAGSCIQAGAAKGTFPLLPTQSSGQSAQERSLEARWAARLPMQLYTINIKSGEIKTFHPSNDWLNHVQFSPSDPALIMFCHEGPWHKVDRIWTIHTDGSGLTKMHARTMDMEIAGHEFFNPDGKIIWFDLQTPKSKVFWLAGRVLATG